MAAKQADFRATDHLQELVTLSDQEFAQAFDSS